MPTPRISPVRKEREAASVAPAVVLAFPARAKPGSGALAPTPVRGERPTLAPFALRDWLKVALIASIAVHAIVYLVFQLRFEGDVERARGAAAALLSDGTITIPVEVVAESMLPSAPAPSDASSADASEPVPVPPEIDIEKIKELIPPPPEPARVLFPQAAIEMPEPPEPASADLPTREEAARLALPEDERAPPSPAETAETPEIPASTMVFEATAPMPVPREPIKERSPPSTASKAASPSRSAASNSTGSSGAGGAADVGGRAAISSYFARVQAHLLRHRVYPAEARSSGITGVASVVFSLGRDGRVLSASLARGSGHAVLDQAAVAMVRRAAPFPPIPSEIAVSRLEMGAPIRFDLR
jgi:protein TonB